MYIAPMGRSPSNLPRLRWLLLWIVLALPLHGLEDQILALCEQGGSHCHAQDLLEEPHADHLADCESDHPRCLLAAPASTSAHPSPAQPIAKFPAAILEAFLAKGPGEMALRTGPPVPRFVRALSPYRTRVGLILYS